LMRIVKRMAVPLHRVRSLALPVYAYLHVMQAQRLSVALKNTIGERVT
jgi:hypothetical protein